MCQLCAGGALTSAYLFDTLVTGKGGGGGGKKEEEEEDKAEDYDQVVDMVNHGDRQFGGRDDSKQSSFD